jgi:hypothetical protein
MAALRFSVQTTFTDPAHLPGGCRGQCDTHGFWFGVGAGWDEYAISFDQLRQEGWGSAVPFEPDQVEALLWTPKATNGFDATSCYDFWLDDVAFY